MKLKVFKKIPLGLICVITLSFVPLIGYFHPGLPVTHDGMDHVARVANFYKSLSEGNVVPRWAENLNWGYGHPILMFLYPLSSYAASLFHFFTISYIESVKLVFVVSYIASGITMYLWARKQFNEYGGIAAAALYLYAPYRFVDMYVRGAIGEHVALIFPPLVLYFMLRFFNSKSRGILELLGVGFSFSLLLLSHNAISIMFLPFIVAYSCVLGYERKDYKRVLLIFLGLVWGLLLSAFFIFPAFFEGKYTLRDIVTGNEYISRFVTPLSLLYGKWSYGITGQFSVQIGLVNLLSIVLASYVFIKRKKERKFLLVVLLFLFLSIFLMLSQSNFLYQTVTTLKKFQFPWRFLNLTIFCSSILGGSIFLLIKKRNTQLIVLSFLLILLITTTFSYWGANGYFSKSDHFYNEIYKGTTDTGESAPIWSVRFMEHSPRSHLEVIEGKASITEIERISTRHKYAIQVISDNARFRENTLYFPNWSVYANGSKTNIQFQDPKERGLITFYLVQGNYTVDVFFKDTKLRVLSNALSLISVVISLIIIFYSIIKKEKAK